MFHTHPAAALSQLRSRRRFLAMAGSAAMAAMGTAALLGPAHPAAAFESWCFDDPVLVIGGQSVHINLGVPVGQRALIKGSTLTVTVPTNVTARLAGTNAANFPITVAIVRSGTWSGTGTIPVTAVGVVNGPAGVPTAIKAWPSTRAWSTMATATTGQRMTIKFGVQPTFGNITRTTNSAP